MNLWTVFLPSEFDVGSSLFFSDPEAVSKIIIVTYFYSNHSYSAPLSLFTPQCRALRHDVAPMMMTALSEELWTAGRRRSRARMSTRSRTGLISLHHDGGEETEKHFNRGEEREEQPVATACWDKHCRQTDGSDFSSVAKFHVSCCWCSAASKVVKLLLSAGVKQVARYSRLR